MAIIKFYTPLDRENVDLLGNVVASHTYTMEGIPAFRIGQTVSLDTREYFVKSFDYSFTSVYSSDGEQSRLTIGVQVADS